MLTVPSKCVGSLTTPSPETVQAAAKALRAAVYAVRAGRNAGLPLLASHHNAYVRYVAFLAWFSGAARSCAVLDWRATFSAAQWFTYFDDKATGPLGLPRPMLVPRTLARQLVLYASHCDCLHLRLTRRKIDSTALRRRLRAIEAAQDVALLFCIGPQGEVRSVGTSWVLNGLPPGLELANDAGRHYFGTHLLWAEVAALLIDIYLRHGEGGVESLSSTSVVSLRHAWSVICPLIDAELERIGLAPLAGLAGD